MDTGKIKDNIKYYEGYEGETETIITYKNVSYHIWNGYIEDIFGDPVLSGDDWNGFTRDYNEMVGAYGDDVVEFIISPEEYKADLLLYDKKNFNYEETKEVYEMILSILDMAVNDNEVVSVTSE
ncbi:hypothetical protein SAMN05660484_01135 [Eubacterium ruminantium]|uniref:Uncharacterized protein n=1 Tax=Eubacterium ruminantium TaxID=42322 RepID=A0A1T4MAM1_9FIRM|nr:hypothetical protein [Eubacterium ruminantium]SCW46742.1 hypothetical protein SAMN05660484_01135 [Eubacterium ruminantium]SDM53319.1 hypothetical protein SAMN04490370_1047 [Eubacterium ruminantium]SJZ64059.1 hypothetical protein SAMN02745110_01136 [Eubacterium ruminantium]